VRKPQHDSFPTAGRHVVRGAVPLCLEWRMERAVSMRGGILADKIGSGKTLTCIALVVRSVPKAPEELQAIEPNLLPLDATFVLCPNQIFHHWSHEGPKFGLQVSVLELDNVAKLCCTDLPAFVRQQVGPTIIVAPYAIFNDPSYTKRLASPLGSASWRCAMPARRARGAHLSALALEAFVWRRVVFDELHEVQNSDTCVAHHSIYLRLRAVGRHGNSAAHHEFARICSCGFPGVPVRLQYSPVGGVLR